ncbi:hypothetical protein [Streptomyces sp. NPDC089799]|uniref:hypothetical protein n=1 Tax=Streptomyces sp. NPDC089799 TaxID=3155066 RepID=UPI00341FC4AD
MDRAPGYRDHSPSRLFFLPPVPEDSTVPLSLPSRRSLLTGAAGAAGAVLLTGCSDSDARPGAHAGVSPERRLREAAVRDSRGLLERYDATLAAHPALGGRLAPLRAAVAAHVAALAPPDAPGGAASPSAKPSPSATRSPVAPPAAGAPAAPAVPQKAEEALGSLAVAERSLAEARTITLAEAPGELARLLASVAACGIVHHHLLTAGGDQEGTA